MHEKLSYHLEKLLRSLSPLKMQELRRKIKVFSRFLELSEKDLERIAALAKLDDRTIEGLEKMTKAMGKYGSTTLSAEELVAPYITSHFSKTKSLDLGCGPSPRNPFNAEVVYGVDIREDLHSNIKQADLSTEPLPFKENLFDYCTAFDLIEHIPRKTWQGGVASAGVIDLMNEIYRILKPGGLFLHSTPAFPFKEAFQDPTHVNIITEDTFPDYFCMPHNLAAELGYGFLGKFELIDQKWSNGSWLVGVMRAVK